MRSVVAGLGLALLLCAMNSYLTLSFGVIEEGPTIAALFFFALFFLSKSKITSTEMVMVEKFLEFDKARGDFAERAIMSRARRRNSRGLRVQG